MNNESTPPPVPSSSSVYSSPSSPNPSTSGTLPLGSHPDDTVPINGVTDTLDAMLRHPRRVIYQLRTSQSAALIGALILMALVCSLIYGVVVGSFSGETQYWAAPAKIAGGLFISALICLPSLYIFSCLSGSEARLTEVIGLVMGLLALMTILLIGFAPVAWVFSQSTVSIAAMGALHLIFWAVATYFGLRFLNHGLKHLGGKPAGLRVWTIVFLLVMLQMTTALRPIIGKSDHLLTNEKKFFLKHWAEQFEAGDALAAPAARR